MLEFLAAFFVTCLAHEYGHITAALLMGVPVKQLGWKSYHGAFIRRERSLELWRELVITAAGPMVNFALACVLYPRPWWWSFNLVLGITSLLPLLTASDGDRITMMLIRRFQVRVRLDAIAKGWL